MMDEMHLIAATIEQLKRDLRPSFIVDLASYDPSKPIQVPIAHFNPALAALPEVVAALTRSQHEIGLDWRTVKFRYWATRNSAQSTDTAIKPYDFQSILWISAPLTATHSLISGLPKSAIEAPINDIDVVDTTSLTISLGDVATSLSASVDENRRDDKEASESKHLFGENLVEQRPYIDLFYSIDWAKTSLGPLEKWSDELRVLSHLVLADPQPSFLFLGEELYVVHNAAGANFLPDAKGVFMGSTPQRVFPAVYPAFAPIFQNVMAQRQPQIVPNAQMAMMRNGRLEERFFNFHFLPIIDRRGNCLGIYESAREVTKENLSQRRLSTLLKISACAGRVRDKKLYWTRLLDAMAVNKEDMGFALLYSLEYSSEDETQVLQQDCSPICTLEGTFGIPEDSASASPHINLDTDTFGYALGLKHALETKVPVILDVDDHHWLPSLLDGILCRGFGAPCQGVVICPVRPTGATKCVAFVVIGLSARVVLDAEFKQFLDIMDRHIASSVASVLLFDEELSRERQRVKDATLVHASLQDRLKRKDQQLLSVETKFQRMTDRMPVAVYTTNSQGTITYANEAFYTTTGHSGAGVELASWLATVHEDHRALSLSKFKEVWSGNRVQFEVKLNKMWTKSLPNTETISAPTWILVSTFVDKDHDGGSETLIAILTDISDQKWAESLQYRRMLEALEAKKQQEDFVDTVSHEIRNPLSAILQSVDEISDYLNLVKAGANVAGEQLQGSLDAIRIVTLCCQHQQRVVDDILLLSKVKSKMLTVCPAKTDIPQLIQKVIMMSSAEVKHSGITITVVLGDALRGGDSSMLMVDPNRVTQILVNLISNAVKFTQASADRRIDIHCDIHFSRPSIQSYQIKYMDVPTTGNTGDDVKKDAAEEEIYLHFIVQDTGIGMSEAQKDLLFARFAQATPRTHIKYGGSGLGLFICKQLCALQGGSIGLNTTEDKGTTIGFFVKATRARPTLEIMPQQTPHSNGATVVGGTTAPKDNLSRPLRLSSHEADSTTKPEAITVLVVEDNLVNQRVMVKQLQRLGFTVYKANNGVEALEFLGKTNRWNRGSGHIELSMILLDIEMPIMDGLTCVSRIRQLEVAGSLLGKIPVIAVSANARDEQMAQARSAGMDDIVCKPFRIADVVSKIRALLALAAG